jgi:hypothetical protein
MRGSVNRVIFERLIDEGGIACEGGSLDVASPLATPIDPDRVEGMLLGLAVGNALGLPTEGLKPHDRSARVEFDAVIVSLHLSLRWRR